MTAVSPESVGNAEQDSQETKLSLLRYKARRNSRREMRRQMKELKALMHGLIFTSGCAELKLLQCPIFVEVEVTKRVRQHLLRA